MFYGWWIVAAVLGMLAVSSGLAFYNLSVLLAALTADGRFSVAAASGAPSLFFVSSSLVGLVVAVIIERYDIRISLFVGSVTCAISLVFIGQAETLWQLYLAFILFGAGFAASALLPCTTLVTRWFVQRRAIALAVASSGLSVGGVCLTPLSAWLIGGFGLREGTYFIAALYVLCSIPVILVLRPHPATMGLSPDGTGDTVAGNRPFVTPVAFSAAVRSRFFALLTLSYTCILLSQVGAIAHLFKLASERVDSTVAAFVLSLMAGFSIVARLLGGWSANYVSHRSLATGAMIGQAVAMGLMAEADTKASLLLAVAVFGISVGNILMLLPLQLAEAFGVRHFSRLYSISQLVTTLGVACGPLLIGIIYDFAGGYRAAFWVAAGMSILAVIIMLCAGRRRPASVPCPEPSATD